KTRFEEIPPHPAPSAPTSPRKRGEGEPAARATIIRRSRLTSLPLHLGVVDHLAPLRLLDLDVFRELLVRAGDRFEVLPLQEILFDIGIGEDLVHFGVDL